MLQNELHDGRRIVQSVGMMTDAGLVNDLDRAPEPAVTLGDDGRVFRGDDVIGIADDVDDGHLGCGQGARTSTGLPR